MSARFDRAPDGVKQDIPIAADALFVVRHFIGGVDREHEIGDAGFHELGKELGPRPRAAIAVRVHHDVRKAELRGLADERHDLGMERRLAAIVELDGAHAHLSALAQQSAIELGVHVAPLIRVLVEAELADVLVGPDLAEPPEDSSSLLPQRRSQTATDSRST